MKDLKLKMANTAERVQYALGWTPEQYAEFQFDQAYEFLKYWVGEDVFGYRELPLTALFWAWWRNQWHRRDADFVRSVKDMPIEWKQRTYRAMHSPQSITRTPGRVIMDDAYAKMIYQLTHAEPCL